MLPACAKAAEVTGFERECLARNVAGVIDELYEIPRDAGAAHCTDRQTCLAGHFCGVVGGDCPGSD
jgi:hypothetical protein